MTLKIEVYVPQNAIENDVAGSYLDRALSAIGFLRGGVSTPAVISATEARPPAEQWPAVDETPVEHAAPEEPAKQADYRQRGKAGEGRARRTKAEMAEDEELEKLASAAGVPIEKVDEHLANNVSRERIIAELSAVAADKSVLTDDDSRPPQISTGENRVGPHDDPETEAQDAADEAAEAAATSKGLTLDDLRLAAGAYQKKFGMAAAVKDVPALLGRPMAEVADTDLGAAIGILTEAAELNPYGRDIVGGDFKDQLVQKAPEPAPEPQATKQDVIEAMLAYARKYDGPDADPADATSMPFTNEDAPKVFKMLFGAECSRLGLVPATPEAYGKALAGIREMTDKDPFKRGGGSK
ncbi:hypothetical protein NPA31_011720 [Aurantimonas sp. MSK8Z-1]|uniref:hypothetical protein n=1 Tax=Mangrovibrevibacter kandeliae TaxID=2968473 RepID=UPI002119AB48|nr:hypothetical protein [Aurantimonas sp. MSK8Z-1]MCW4115631.1 hypothetical protein [Aurantimonas sp. MSK8Z-1]